MSAPSPSSNPALKSASNSDRAALLDRLRQLERAARPLEPGPARRRELRAAVVDSTERFLREVDSLKAYDHSGDRGDWSQGILAAPIGEQGIPLADALELLEREVLRPGANPSSGGHLAYIPGGAIYHGALGDFLAAVSNKYAGIFFSGVGAIRLENLLVRWVADLVGYPATAGGVHLSGGSLASLTAIVAARDAHRLRGADYASAVVYLTDQANHSFHKALRIAGLGEARIREVPLDERSRMRPDALADTIAADRAAGLRPWLIAAAAGATATGAVDPLDALADVAARENCWFHVDAAYGGFFLLTDHGRAVMKGIERSDSAVLDPHKSLFLPWGSGMIVARDARTLLAAHSAIGASGASGTTGAIGATGAYMQDAHRQEIADPYEISPSDLSPELTKHFRALRMWLPLIHLGTAPFRAALDEKLLLARYFHQEIQKIGYEVGPEPELSIVTFRWAPPGVSPERADEMNQQIVDNVRRDGRIFLSSTQLGGRFTLRMAALAFRTHRRHIDLALEILREQAGVVGG
jgi:aromatic-L-amino-acid/L-tryptophan decarboxylase